MRWTTCRWGSCPPLSKLPLNAEKQGVKVALGMDVRDPAFVDTFPGVFQQLCREGWWLDLYFLDASDQALLQRYSETRRKHPLANGREDERQVLKRERTLLAPVKEQASHVIDTSRHTVHDLRREIHSLFKELAPPAPFRVTVMSFGFKHGIPFEADLVMDVRFLKNPHFVTNPEAKNRTGSPGEGLCVRRPQHAPVCGAISQPSGIPAAPVPGRGQGQAQYRRRLHRGAPPQRGHSRMAGQTPKGSRPPGGFAPPGY